MNNLLVIVLTDENLLDDVLSAMVECEIPDASILDGISMQEILVKEVPIFAGLLLSSKSSRFVTKVILAPLESATTATELNDVLISEQIDFTRPDVGYMFVIPVTHVIHPFEVGE
ncbi:MAG: hypothetical protein D6675_12050 [Gemmatimonadetes bacterium]|nr:MAG: hypothetical protein D6675_12050 [Gemmatimonadota bacterium]